MCCVFMQVEHEDWYLSRQYYTQRRHALRSAWSRDRHDLLTKVSHVFEEACWRQQEADETAKARHMQKQICRDLSDKVGFVVMNLIFSSC